MIFPLKNRTLIRGFAAHVAAGLGGGADYVANHDPLLAPFDTTIEKQYYGNDGGNWLWVQDEKGNMLEFAHLANNSYAFSVGVKVHQGETMAITDNTGNITTGEHLHIQIIQARTGDYPGDPIKGIRLDPEIYFSQTHQANMAIERVVNAQKKRLSDLQNGIVAGAYDPATKKWYLVKDGKKRELPFMEVTNALYFPFIDSATLDQIPNV